MIKNIGFAITGSFCTHDKALIVIKQLTKKYNVIPILSENVFNTDTRFGRAKEYISKLEEITNNKVISSIVSAEPIGPKNLVDIIIVAPCTGNTLSKITHAITDTTVTMAVKSHLRSNKPVVIGVSSNDSLEKNFENIGKLFNSKNIFFVPMVQDDYIKKPNSLVCDFSLIEKTMDLAINKQQIQPIFITK